MKKSLLIEAPQPEVKPAPAPAPQQQNKPKEQPAAKSSKTYYTVQVMASKSAISTSDSRFGSYKGKVKQVRADGAFSYKYCVGEYADRKAAQAAVPTVRKVFPQAFVIAVKDGRVVTSK